MAPFEELVLFDEESIRDTEKLTSLAQTLGADGLHLGVIIIENSLDQSIAVQMQARARDGSVWCTVTDELTVTASVAGAITITFPWQLVRILVTAGVVPSSGSVSSWLSRARR